MRSGRQPSADMQGEAKAAAERPIPTSRASLLPGLAVCLLITALLAWFFAGAVFGGGLFAYRDAAHYYYPLFQFIQQQWAAHRVPLWNPYENLGAPLLANATASVLYPGKLVFLLPLEYAWSYRLYVIGHVLLAAAATYGVARRWNASPWGAGVAAISYAFCGNVLFQYCNAVYLVGAAWLPVALLQSDRMLARRSLRGAIGLGVVLALMILGGDPQAAYHAGLLTLGYALLARSRVPSPQAGENAGYAARLLRSRTALVALAAATVLALAAVQILPSAEFSRLSGRAAAATPRSLYELPSRTVRDHSGNQAWYDGLLCRNLDPQTHLEHIYQFSVGPWRLAEYVWPNFSGRQFPYHRRWIEVVPAEGRVWTPSLYMGLLPLVLAISAWRLRGGDPCIRWMSWAALLAILASLGWYGPGWILREIFFAAGMDPDRAWIGPPVGGLYWFMTVVLPGYVYFRYPAKLLAVAALALSLLAARGWDESLTARSPRLRRGLLLVAATSAAGALVVLSLGPWWSAWMAKVAPDPIFGPLDAAGSHWDLWTSLAQTAAVSVVFYLLLRLPERIRWMPGLAMVLAGVDLAIANGWLIACVPTEVFHRPPVAATALKSQNAADAVASDRVSRDELWVPPSWQDRGSADRMLELVRWNYDCLWPNYQLPNGLSLTNVPTSLVVQDYRAWLSLERDSDLPAIPGSPITGNYAIRHSPPAVPSARRIELPGTNRRELDDLSLWYFPDHLPRAWIVHQVDVLPPLERDDLEAVLERTREVFWASAASGSGDNSKAIPRDLHHTAVVEADLSPEAFSSVPAARDSETCQILRYEPLEVEIQAELRQPGLVVLSDQFYPGWKLEVATEGQETRAMPILRTNRVMRGAWLEAGKHRLIYRYRPPAFLLGASISLIAWTVLAVVAARGRMRLVQW